MVAPAASPNLPSNPGIIEPLIALASLIHVAPAVDLGLSVTVLSQREVFLAAGQTGALDILSEAVHSRCRLGLAQG